MNTRNIHKASLPLDDLDRFLITAAIKIGRVADDISGALMIFAHFADGDNCGVTPTDIMALMNCTPSRYMQALRMLDASGIRVPPGWRLS
jgi:hypothetical protein